MENKIQKKLEKWKNNLLDLSKRNALINSKFTKLSNMQINTPDMFTLWDYFCVKEKTIAFPYIPEHEKDLFSDSQEKETKEDEKKLDKYKPFIDKFDIVTNHTLRDNQKIIRLLRKKARITREEQGIHVLFLCFGFLHWGEKDHRMFDAPLVLVPVNIENKDILKPHVVSMCCDEEIVVNPTLAFKLKNDFGFELPEFNQDEGIEIFFETLRKRIQATDWEVKETVGLCPLSFAKINMYIDLRRNAERISQHPIVRTIVGETSGSEDEKSIEKEINEKLGSGIDNIDELNGVNTFQILDSDASQQEAIFAAKKGLSFVLQGPPGTGKSQTIANIIAEQIAMGKKVLFVAEKMAALEVVYRRLAKANLGDFCLIMHNSKQNKLSVMEQFSNVMELSSQAYSVKNAVYSELNRLEREKIGLKAYYENVYKVIQPLNISVYQANGVLAKYCDIPSLRFKISGIDHITQDVFEDMSAILDKYADVKRSMKIAVRDNPWKNFTISNLSNELNQDLNKQFLTLRKLTTILFEKIGEVKNRWLHQFDYDFTLSDVKKLITTLNIATEKRSIPTAWIFDDRLSQLYSEIEEQNQLQKEYLDQCKKIVDANISLLDVDLEMTNLKKEGLFVLADVEEEIALLDKRISDDKIIEQFKDASIRNLNEKICELEQVCAAYNERYESLVSEFDKDILTIDYGSLLAKFRTDFSGCTRFFKKDYYYSKKQIRAYLKKADVQLTDTKIVDILVTIQKLYEIESELLANDDVYKVLFGDEYLGVHTDCKRLHHKCSVSVQIGALKELLNSLRDILLRGQASSDKERTFFGTYYSGFNTDWNDLKHAVDWADALKKSVRNTESCRDFIVAVCSGSLAVKEWCGRTSVTLQETITAIDDVFDWLQDKVSDKGVYYDMPLDKLGEHFLTLQDNIALLYDMVHINSIIQQCKELRIDACIRVIIDEDIAADMVLPAFEKRFYSLWLDKVTQHLDGVHNFRQDNHERSLNNYKKWDRNQIITAQTRLYAKLVELLPAVENNVGEVHVLRREMSKKRRIMPLRKLFSAIPHLIMALKPCIMMSPLSVSRYLESNEFEFDTVIFDEASQVCTENAIGAIVRGKQVIIAGDSKQLPPTRFFQGMLDTDYDEYNEDDETDNDVFDSLLDEANALPCKTLLWHYRSMNEDLITFSNFKFYKGRLITFPGPMINAKNTGVEYVYVSNGVYNRGGHRWNINEAIKVVDLIFEHIKGCVESGVKKTLGVIAFSVAQQTAIEEILWKRRQENSQFEAFFDEACEEPFFVKNLENVQGDERDTIIMSIGYARDEHGVMHQNYGPLGKQGGECRLNVAITRAKLNLKLVGSIQPMDIEVDKITTEGPKCLREYIEFAQRGPSILQGAVTVNSELRFDSPFEEAVYDVLVKAGYSVATQVGCSGYRIDLAVRHPDYFDTFVIGIECDGASYHSARSARERDRLRQDVLEKMGWRIYRIWSTEWIKDPKTKALQLLDVVEYAIRGKKRKAKKYVSSKTVEGTLVVEGKKENIAELDDYPDSFVYPNKIENLNDLDMQIVQKIDYLVTCYAPVNFDILCREYVKEIGGQKVTNSVRDSVKRILSCNRDKWQKITDGTFYVPTKEGWSCTPRKAGRRTIDEISTTEIMEGMVKVLTGTIGISPDELVAETARAFGFKRTTDNVSSKVDSAYKELLKQKRIDVSNDKVIVL